MRSIVIWGISSFLTAGPAVAQTAVAPPVPEAPVTDWVHPDDYPPASLRAQEEGRVSVQLHVDANGMVSGCQVTNSSGHSLLDARTCTILTQRAHFRPARDASGQVIAAITPVMSFRWQMPAGTSASVSAPSPSPSPSLADAKTIAEETAFFRTLGGPPLPADQPVTPERITLAKRLISISTNGDDQQMLENLGRSLIDKRFAPTIAGLPPHAQTLAKADLEAAYEVAWQDSRRHNLDRMARYDAARLTDDEMRKISDFYASGIGYRHIHHNGAWAPADRLAFGKAAVERPELAKWTRLNVEQMQGLAVRLQEQQQLFQSELTAALCPRLARDHIRSSACPIVKPALVTGKARPPRLMTTHL